MVTSSAQAVLCAPTSLISRLHYQLPHLSNIRFGGTEYSSNHSVAEVLPGEIEHVVGWSLILLILAIILLLVPFYLSVCCLICKRCKQGKCLASSRIVQRSLLYTNVAFAGISILVALCTFIPASLMHNAITSSADDVQTFLPEIAVGVVQKVLLKLEQERHKTVIAYLLILLPFLMLDILLAICAKKCTSCSTGILCLVTALLALATCAFHIPLVIFLFAVIVVYSDVCIGIYSLGESSFCMNSMKNVSLDTTNSLNVFCNQTVYYGLILIIFVTILAALLLVVQLGEFSYIAWICCYKGNYYFDDNELDSNISLDDHELNDISVSSSIPWASQHDVVELVQVQKNSPEWNKVQNQVKTTLTKAKMTNLHRIQNKWLWESYKQSKRRLGLKNRNRLNEKMLFHGTSKNPPDKIYSSEKGFDFRFANRGLWGEGSYFAVNASYSDAYAYIHGQTKQMLLALVLTGESVSCASDKSLKQPPMKPTTSQGENMFTDERYDSVKGEAGGSVIYIIYEHDKAYPLYLIEYNVCA